ncbi:MAG: monovalent cation/H(+) antiporter subunit G [Dehalococcoidia bacterium]
MSDLLRDALLVIGAAFLALAALGIARMPDVFSRMQTATKASTFGIAFMLVAAGVHFAEVSITARVAAVIAFFLLTAPVARLRHRPRRLLRRRADVGGTIADELRGHYDERTHELSAADAPAARPPDRDGTDGATPPEPPRPQYRP